MKTETIVVKLDVVKIVKTTSREAIKSIPRPQRIEDKRKRKPRYGWKDGQ